MVANPTAGVAPAGRGRADHRLGRRQPDRPRARRLRRPRVRRRPRLHRRARLRRLLAAGLGRRRGRRRGRRPAGLRRVALGADPAARDRRGDPGTSFVEPAYGDRVAGRRRPRGRAARSASRSAATAAGLVLPAAPSYVVFLVDGLGRRAAGRATPHAAPYLSSLLDGRRTGTAGVPSTTATSLTSLGTGLTPGAHGLVGFTSRVPGTDRLLNPLFWDKRRRPASSGSRTRPRSPGWPQAGVHVTVGQQARVRRLAG